MSVTAVPSSRAAESSMHVARPRPLLAVWTLAAREWVRFVRQRNRVIGAIGQPLIFWLLFGAGLGPAFRLPSAGGATVSYREYFFPGSLVLILLFTAIFATISIIEDRREGFLQSVLVAPAPRWAMVLGKILGGTAIAAAQGMLFLLLGLTLHLTFSLMAIVQIVAFVFVVAMSLTALGFVLAWRMDSTQGFHAVMSVLLMPMWLLSGAFFPVPYDTNANWGQWLLAWVMKLNPLTYGVAGLRRLVYYDLPNPPLEVGTPSLAFCWGVTLAFGALMLAASWKIAGGRTTGDLL